MRNGHQQNTDVSAETRCKGSDYHETCVRATAPSRPFFLHQSRMDGLEHEPRKLNSFPRAGHDFAALLLPSAPVSRDDCQEIHSMNDQVLYQHLRTDIGEQRKEVGHGEDT